MNRSLASFSGLRALVLAVVVASASPVLAQNQLSAEDLATVRVDIVDLLASEPNLPLPVRQRKDALAAYYAGQNGELLWLGQKRAPGIHRRGFGRPRMTASIRPHTRSNSLSG